jgi:UTP--glucose-1-phosphate uridylyltransferase
MSGSVMTIKKAIFPVGGSWHPFLPASKSIPKEMVTVVDRPAIEYVVREAVAAGIEQIILVTHSSKASIEIILIVILSLKRHLNRSKNLIYSKKLRIFYRTCQRSQCAPTATLRTWTCSFMCKVDCGNDDFAVLLPDVLVKDLIQLMI